MAGQGARRREDGPGPDSSLLPGTSLIPSLFVTFSTFLPFYRELRWLLDPLYHPLHCWSCFPRVKNLPDTSPGRPESGKNDQNVRK